jgi:hypothetical protein
MQYAMNREYQTKQDKVGCIHEMKTNGLEKLRMMGGFKITDLMYYRNNYKYYLAYLENGFVFHSALHVEKWKMSGGDNNVFKEI